MKTRQKSRNKNRRGKGTNKIPATQACYRGEKRKMSDREKARIESNRREQPIVK